MNGADPAYAVYLIAVIVFVASGFLARRVPVGHSLRMLAAWVMIFLAGFVIFSLKDNIVGFARQVMDERKAESTGVQVGGELRIKQSADGHFWVDAAVNGQTVRFLIDSGATTTSLSVDAARIAGVESGGGFPVLVDTANGTVSVQRGRVKDLRVGNIQRRDFAVHVSEAFGDMNVLGMNFLSSLSGWRVERGKLILTP
jgi:aspartyl protease family protein